MLLKKQEKEPARPQLLGEDFDIFPNLNDSPQKTDLEPAADAPPPEDDDIGIDEETLFMPTEFQKKVEAIPEEKWKRYQILGGIGLGVLCALCITVLNRIEGLPSIVSMVAALVLAVYGPRFFESKAKRAIPKTRIALVITAVLCFGLYMLYGFLFEPALFTAA